MNHQIRTLSYKMFTILFSHLAFALVAVAFTICYFYIRYVYAYWQRRGVAHLKPLFPFGNFRKNLMQELSIGEQIDEIYRSTTEPFVGAYAVFRPILIPRDPTLIRAMLIKDFQHFTDRGVYNNEENEPLTGMLFSTTGDKWRNLRTKLTPTFTSGKMRSIFGTILDCKRSLEEHVREAAHADKWVEAYEMSACYTTNVIGEPQIASHSLSIQFNVIFFTVASVAFGIDINCLADPNIPFRLYGREFFMLTLKNAIRQIFFAISPALLKWSGLRMMDRDVEQFFISLTEKTLELREKNNIVRKDFFQLLVQLRNSGNVQLDDEWHTVIANDNSKTLTLNEMSAQVFVFYLAGFESGASTMTYFLYEIAQNPDIQRKLHEEIDHVLAQHGGQFTYDSINDLGYLECCIDGWPLDFSLQLCHILKLTIL